MSPVLAPATVDTLRVEVVSGDLHPVAGAEVRCTSGNGWAVATRTDAAGAAMVDLSDFPPGSMTVRVGGETVDVAGPQRCVVVEV